MRIRCAACGGVAEISGGFASVSCSGCGTEMAYGEYVRMAAHSDPAYSDILGDYGGSAGQGAGTLDEWDGQEGPPS